MASAPRKPTFIGIGAQKCASTWLYRVLREHPDVFVSDTKELDFFSFGFDRGFQWYERHFAGRQQERACGEISPSYFCEPEVPHRVFDYNAAARIIVSFRDPVERALSNHRHEVRLGHFTGDDLSFEAGLANNPMYVRQGLYATHLKRWLEYFPAEQLFAVTMEDIEREPLAVARRLYAFVGVDTAFEPPGIRQRFNVSYANRSQGLRRVKDWAYKAASLPGLRWTWSLGHALGLRAMYRKVNTVPSAAAIPEPSAELLDALRQQFLPEVQELSWLLDRPLDAWTRAARTAPSRPGLGNTLRSAEQSS